MSGVMVLTSSSKRFGIAQLIGDYETHRDKWEQQSCLNLIENLVGLDKGIIIDCGIDDFTIEVNRQIHRKLMEIGIPHNYTITNDPAHTAGTTGPTPWNII